jgi:hypothetical protein
VPLWRDLSESNTRRNSPSPIHQAIFFLSDDDDDDSNSRPSLLLMAATARSYCLSDSRTISTPSAITSSTFMRGPCGDSFRPRTPPISSVARRMRSRSALVLREGRGGETRLSGH